MFDLKVFLELCLLGFSHLQSLQWVSVKEVISFPVYVTPNTTNTNKQFSSSELLILL